MPTVHLPNGATAEICDEEGLTGYAEQVVLDIMSTVDDMEHVSMGRFGAAFLRSRVELLPHVVTSWSYDAPVTLDTVMRLPRSARHALVAATKHLHTAIISSVKDDEAEADPKKSGSSSAPPERPS